MKLILSDDGKVNSGTATSKPGNCTGQIEFKQIHLVAPSVDWASEVTRCKTLIFGLQRAKLRDL